MTPVRIVFVHGRSQEHKDPSALKAEWISAFSDGLKKGGFEFAIDESDIRFPYYGQTLHDLEKKVPLEEVQPVVVRGEGEEHDELVFLDSVLREIRERKNVTDSQVLEVSQTQSLEQGPLNWEWVQGSLKAIDRFVPGASSTSIALATRDVYRYLRSHGIRDEIENGIKQAFEPKVPMIVVSHSLGTVVAYNLLRREGVANGWVVPLFVTLGSPLGINAIRKTLAPIKYPECVQSWFNALDERDVVALYPLNKKRFMTDPPIDNYGKVRNETANRHGISGYLSDQLVAERICKAVTSCVST